MPAHAQRSLAMRGASGGGALVIASCACLLWAVPVRASFAQGAPARVATAQMQGVVRDTAARPIPGAGVEIDGDGVWRAVGADGAFVVRELAPGVHLLRVRALGFARAEASVPLAAGDTTRVEVTLERSPVMLDTVRSMAPAERASTFGPPEFQARRRIGRGIFRTRDEFERHVPTRISDLLIQMPGVVRQPVESPTGTTEYVIVMRGVSTTRGEICPVSVYLDGRGFPGGVTALDGIVRPNEIDAIEVYTGASQVPPRFSGATARCGVIALWTRSSAG